MVRLAKAARFIGTARFGLWLTSTETGTTPFFMPSNADSQPREDGCECAGSARLPRTLIAAVAALACLPIGLLWDISHHSSIGRDTFWTPAHIVIQFGGIVPALLFLVIACKTTFRGTTQERACSVALWGARAPLGVWVTLWGALAMMTSAPFDDWWHNAYGLDVKIASPPHSVLGLGMFAVGMGVLLVVFSSQNRADPRNTAEKRNNLRARLRHSDRAVGRFYHRVQLAQSSAHLHFL